MQIKLPSSSNEMHPVLQIHPLPNPPSPASAKRAKQKENEMLVFFGHRPEEERLGSGIVRRRNLATRPELADSTPLFLIERATKVNIRLRWEAASANQRTPTLKAGHAPQGNEIKVSGFSLLRGRSPLSRGSL